MKVERQLRDRLIALAGCADPNPTFRPVIAAICFETDVAVATDAYVLGHVALTDGPADPVLVPAKPFAQTLRRASKKADIDVEFGDRIVVTVTTAMLGDNAVERTELPPITDGEFPEWRRFFPDRAEPRGAMPMFDPAKVGQIARLRSDKQRPIYLTWDTENGRTGPMTVHDGDGSVLGLVMPTSEVPS